MLTQAKIEEILQDFKQLGETASYHYADDSTKEWDLASRAEQKALEIFDNHPDLEEKFREIALGFLWSLSMKRPKNTKIA